MVVFEHRPDRGIFRWLAPGFRHVFLVSRRESGWRIVDPMSVGPGVPDLCAVDCSLLQAALAAVGGSSIRLRCDPCTHQRPNRPWRLRPLTCVELVKQALALRSGGFTPLDRKSVV